MVIGQWRKLEQARYCHYHIEIIISFQLTVLAFDKYNNESISIDVKKLTCAQISAQIEKYEN